ncbi:MAG: hypothetical protein ACKOT0_12450 [bacterium]
MSGTGARGARWLGRTAAVLALCVALPLCATAPSLAAEDRARLRGMISDARADLRATSKAVTGLTKEDRVVVRSHLATLRLDASDASAALGAAKTAAELTAVGRRVRLLSTRSRSLLDATRMAASALSALSQSRQRAGSLVTSWIAGRLPAREYAREQSHWALVGAHATRDHARAMSAIRRWAPPPAATTPAALSRALEGVSPAAVAGLTPIPGGCGLPAADPAAYLGTARAPGLHLWTSDAQVAAARARLADPSPALATAHRSIVQRATVLLGEPVDPTSGGGLTTRALRIGYAWLSTQRPEFAAAMASDIAAVTASVLPVADLPDEAKIALATATNVDWLAPGADPALEASLQQAREVILVRSLGEMSCAIALGQEALVKYPNKAVVVAGSATTAALAVAGPHPAAAAALVAASVRMGKPAFAPLATDGGSPEGPSYWNFQTVPLAGMLSSFDSVLAGAALTGVPDFRETGSFAYDAPSTAGQVTRYSDTDTGELRCTLPSWIAGRWGGAEATAVALAGRVRLGVELLWWPEESAPASVAPRSRVFPATGLAVVHAGEVTAWLKGQAPLSGHTQLDAGTLGLALGDVEFTMDPGYGPQADEAAPGYSDNAPDGRRWTYPQTRPQWHSTLRSGAGLGQVVGATATVAGGPASATVDLAAVLPGVTRAVRTVEVTGQGLTMRDAVVARGAREFSWGWMTDAKVSLSGNTAYLSKGGRTVTVTWSGLPSGSSVTVVEVPTELRYLTGTRTVLLSVSIPASSALDVTTHVTWG